MMIQVLAGGLIGHFPFTEWDIFPSPDGGIAKDAINSVAFETLHNIHRIKYMLG